MNKVYLQLLLLIYQYIRTCIIIMSEYTLSILSEHALLSSSDDACYCSIIFIIVEDVIIIMWIMAATNS